MVRPIGAVGENEAEEDVRLQTEKQTIQSTALQNAQAAADRSTGVETIKAVEEELYQVQQDTDRGGRPATTAALERLKGRKDSFSPREPYLRMDTDRVDQQIMSLKKLVSGLKERVSQNQDPSQTEQLAKELQEAEAELRIKGTDAYRRHNADYTFL